MASCLVDISTCSSTQYDQQLTCKRYHKEKVVEDAHHFANTHELAEYSELFGRAALVARDKDFTQVSELTPEELAALHYERDHKWHGTKMLWYSIGLCAVGAATQGMSILFHIRNSIG